MPDEDLAGPINANHAIRIARLAEPVRDEAVKRAVACGGTVVPANNPYWHVGGVTIADPDGYRLVLTQRSWG